MPVGVCLRRPLLSQVSWSPSAGALPTTAPPSLTKLSLALWRDFSRSESTERCWAISLCSLVYNAIFALYHGYVRSLRDAITHELTSYGL